jgi:hypothetical protein
MDYNFTKYREPRPALKIKKDRDNKPNITTTRRSIDSSRTLVDQSSSTSSNASNTNSASEEADKEKQLEQEQHAANKSKNESSSSSKLSDRLKPW